MEFRQLRSGRFLCLNPARPLRYCLPCTLCAHALGSMHPSLLPASCCATAQALALAGESGSVAAEACLWGALKGLVQPAAEPLSAATPSWSKVLNQYSRPCPILHQEPTDQELTCPACIPQECAARGPCTLILQGLKLVSSTA